MRDIIESSAEETTETAEAIPLPVLLREHTRRLQRKSTIINAVFFIVVFVVAAIVCTFFSFPEVRGNSMEPYYVEGERVFAVKSKNIKIGDVVIAYNKELDQHIVKRVVGVAGDHIEIKNNKFYRNGTEVYEAFIVDFKLSADNVKYDDVVVPENAVYVLGDNRSRSTDSRFLGPISIDDIEYKVLSKLKT